MSDTDPKKKRAPKKRASAQAAASQGVSSKPLSVEPVSKILAYSDIDVSRWREYEHIETGSLWLFNGRDRQNGHQLDYHGNCVPQILTQLISRYTKPGDVILDLFLGSGTSAIEAVNLGRLAIGVELKLDMAQYVRAKLEEQDKADQVVIINGDSSNAKWTGRAIHRALSGFEREQVQFLFLHPPYADIIRFSESENDLSNAVSTEHFLDMFEQVCHLGYETLEPGRFAGLVIGDKYADGELIPLGFLCMERMNRAGFKTKSIIVKNISGNEKAKGRMNNLWRYRALVGGFYIFKHEYVFIMQKPKSAKTRK
jgi:DNA modification methylase